MSINVGDKVIRKDGMSFSNGDLVVTVVDISFNGDYTYIENDSPYLTEDLEVVIPYESVEDNIKKQLNELTQKVQESSIQIHSHNVRIERLESYLNYLETRLANLEKVNE